VPTATGLAAAAGLLVALPGPFGDRVAEAQAQEAWILAERWTGPDAVPPGHIRAAAGSAVDEQGRLYVVDSWRKEVHVFEGDAWVGSWRGNGPSRALMSDPRDIAVFGGRAYVADAGAGRIKVYDTAGNYIADWGDVGRPWGITRYGPERLLVSDNAGARLLLIDLEGRVRMEMGSPGTADGQLVEPRGVAAWPDGALAVLDAGNDRIQVWDSNGRHLITIPNLTELPFRDVAAYGDDGLLVAGLRFLYHYERDTGDSLAGSRAPVPGGFTTVAARLTAAGEWDLPIFATFDHDYLFGLRRFADSRFLLADEWKTLPGPAGEFESPRRIEAAGAGLEILDAWPRSQWLSLDGAIGNQVLLDTSPTDAVSDGALGRFLATGGAIRRMDGPAVTWRFLPPERSTWLSGLTRLPSAGNLVALDVQAQRLLHVTPDGALVATPTLATASYQSFTDIAAGPDSRLYLANRTLGRVEVREPLGALVSSWPVTGVPLRVAPDASGGVFVLTREGWVWRLNDRGQAVAWWDAAAGGTGRRGTPSDLAVGADGRVYVTDERANEVRIYAQDPGSVGDPGPAGDGCIFIRDKWASPPRVVLGRTVDVTLTVAGACLQEGQGADVMLVIDRSGSMAGTKMDGARSAAVGFVGEMDFNVSRVGVVLFSSDAAMPMGLTSAPASVVDAIVGFGDPAGGTDIGAGIQVATDELVRNGRSGVPQILIVMTDGRPEGDAVDADVAARAAKAAGIRVYSIGFGVDVDPVLLERIASAPEDYFFAPGASELSAIYTEIARRISGGVLIRSGVITDVVPSNMVLLEETIAPPPTVVTGREIRWDLVGVREDIELTYKVRPTEAGVWPTNVEAWLAYIDGLDVSGRLAFPIPEVEVVVPLSVYLPITQKSYCKPTQIRADVALVIDASSSMVGDKLEAAKVAAEAFVNKLDLPLDHAAVIPFSSTPTVAAGLTGDIHELRRAIQSIQAETGTAVDSALDAATVELTGPRARERANQVLVLLTDGRNNNGPDPVREAAARARREGILIFTVSFGDDADRELMVEVAGSSTRSFVALTAADLEHIYETIAGIIPCASR
jgi:Mg-chelatase subunit ChlD/DNA-binding beta-propeller fold protein YncE